MKNNYDDIINLPHHKSKKHPQMTLEARSAQFAPFSALTGYSDAVKETARLTDEKIELNDDDIEIINMKLNIIENKIKEKPEVEIVYFVKDKKKSGGSYVTKKARVTKIDLYNNCLYLSKQKVYFDDILDINLE